MYKNIVVCGNIGTGTTTLATNLAKKLGWKHISTGDIYRTYVLKNNIPLWDHSSFPDEIDKEIDNHFLDKVKNETHIVFDTHYGGWLARSEKAVLRILLVCDPKTAAQRVISRQHTHRETSEEIEKRKQGNSDKFHKLYSDEDYENPKWFNLKIDTTSNSQVETLQKALDFFNSK